MPHDRGSGPYEAGEPVTYTSRHQEVLNSSWPLRDKDGFHARGINDQPADKHIPVEVRIEFDVDGSCWVPGLATRWHGSRVFVVVNDSRVIGRQVWVEAGDVRRV